ncbi:MAG: hypothetical protein ACHP7B_07230 [Burkholderiales bacterium]
MTATLAFGATLGLADGRALPLPTAFRLTGLLPLPAGRLAGARLRADAAFGFLLAACFAAGFLAGDLPLAARGDFRAGFTCFFAMVILVR